MQKGFAHIFLIIFLLVGLAVAVYLVQQKTNILPKAADFGPSAPETSIRLWVSRTTYFFPDEGIPVYVHIRSDINPAIAVSAKLNFDKDSLAVDSIIRYDVGTPGFNNTPLLFTDWNENYFDNNTGTVSLDALITNQGGYQTNSTPVTMAIVVFRPLKQGTSSISVADDSSIAVPPIGNFLSIKEGVNITTQPETSGTPPPAQGSQPGGAAVIRPPLAEPVLTVSPTAKCLKNPYSGSEVMVSWINSNPPVSKVELDMGIPDNPDIRTKNVLPSDTITYAPVGFSGNPELQPDQTYHIRLKYGDKYTQAAAFKIPSLCFR